jgi:probable addiction module antidote protein
MKTFDAAHFLDNEETIAEYLNISRENPNPDIFLHALNNVARARGMHNLAKRVHLSEARLNKVLQPGAKPRYTTIHRIMQALKPDVQPTTV